MSDSCDIDGVSRGIGRVEALLAFSNSADHMSREAAIAQLRECLTGLGIWQPSVDDQLAADFIAGVAPPNAVVIHFSNR